MTIKFSNTLPQADLIPIKRALISVSDKSNLIELAKYLIESNIEIISTGGTAKYLRNHHIPVSDVSTITKFPEIMDGRVKTLHPNIHGGLLCLRDNEEHQKAIHTQNIQLIDLLIVNLYPFQQSIQNNDEPVKIIENIDIGGPAMLRAGAKNHLYTTVICNPDYYSTLIEHLKENNGHSDFSFRQKMAAHSFAHTATYDSTIANWFSQQTISSDQLPDNFFISGQCVQNIRYGENPHQKAAVYQYDNHTTTPSIINARIVQGKALSYNNINDADAAFELISEFSDSPLPSVAILKHANPCGVAQGETLLQAYTKALSCDPISAFGGIVAMNHKLDAATAEQIINVFTEVIIAPDADDDALNILSRKKNLRLLLTNELANPKSSQLLHKAITGGFLIQSRDNIVWNPENLQIVTKRTPTTSEMDDLHFAFQIVKHVKSNAIVYAKNLQTVGIGAGQMSRLDSSKIAIDKAQETSIIAGFDNSRIQGSVLASDAFFPFADALLMAVDAGITAVVQPGGSIRDEEVITAANDHGLAMIFTHIRHFKH